MGEEEKYDLEDEIDVKAGKIVRTIEEKIVEETPLDDDPEAKIEITDKVIV